jgi:exonuclease VII small subunit
MNKNRRKMIENIIAMLDKAKVSLEDVLSEEENYFNNMPENLQGSIRGTESEEAIDMLSEAVDNLNNCIDNLTEIN